MLTRFPGASRKRLAFTLVAVAAIGFGGWIFSLSAQNTVATVSVDGFTLSCPASVAEGGPASCTLTNTNSNNRNWPAVGILHLSSDSDRALVRGVPIDVKWGSRTPSASLDEEVEWLGPELVGYSRFDWDGNASPGGARQIPLTIVDDKDYEGAERFYVSLAPSGRRGLGPLYANRQEIVIAQSDSKSDEARLSGLQVLANSSNNSNNRVTGFSADQDSYSAAVGYRVTEVTVIPAAAHKRAAITVNGAPVESGEESAAVSLAAGASTAIVTKVTAENGATKTYTVNVSRGSRPENVSLSAGGFTLSCPSTTTEGATLSCSLGKGSGAAADWPVVAIIHSSADDARALIAGDPIIADNDSRFSQDVKFASPQTPPVNGYNYGYGELFSGGSKSVYTTYGYQKFDWSGSASAGTNRTVSIQVESDELSEPDEVFYVALAPSGYTALSKLVDNKVPIVVRE